jgi:LysR family transcriptional regulator (chromosome initiation inhibitor)
MTFDLDPGQLRALSAAVSEGTLEAAARTLHVTPSAVSQRIKALENAVGRVLLTRSKPVTATPSGQTLLRAARQTQLITADVARDLGDASGVGQVVAMAVNADSLATWLIGALGRLASDLTFDLHRDDEHRTAELLRAGAVMAAVTATAQPVPGCVASPLGRMRYRPRATAAFAARWFPEGATVAELTVAPMVTFDRSDTLQDRYLRRRTRRTLHPPRHYVPGSGAFVQAVAQGLGWGMVPDLQVGDADAAPGLVVLDERGTIDVRLYWQQWRLRSEVLDRVARAIREGAATCLI